MNSNNTCQSIIFIIHLEQKSANQRMGESTNGRVDKSDKVIYLAFSLKKEKNKKQRTSDQ